MNKALLKIIKYLLATIIVVSLGIALIFGRSDIPLDELKSQYASPESQFVLIDGMQVHFRDEGRDSDSIPIVLIHGTGSSLHTFDAWTEGLKHEHRVIRMDLPAYGLTGPFPDRKYSIDRYVEFIGTFLNSLSIEKCVIAGNSLGGQIAWNFTSKYPGRVQKLILIDAAGYPMASKSTPLAFQMARIPIIKNMLTYITPRNVAKSSVENVYANKALVTEELVDRYFELTLREGNRQAFVDRLNIPADTTSYLEIPRIDTETLILWGDRDLLIPVEMAHRFHEDLPNDTLVIMENAGHVPMEERPAESLAIVRSFLRK